MNDFAAQALPIASSLIIAITTVYFGFKGTKEAVRYSKQRIDLMDAEMADLKTELADLQVKFESAERKHQECEARYLVLLQQNIAELKKQETQKTKAKAKTIKT